jgi:hypothetical protein
MQFYAFLSTLTQVHPSSKFRKVKARGYEQHLIVNLIKHWGVNNNQNQKVCTVSSAKSLQSFEIVETPHI